MFVTGFGKASAVMAHAFEKGPPDSLKAKMEGMVIVPDGHGSKCEHIQIIEAAHPVPDERGLKAAARLFRLPASLGRMI